MLPTDNELLVQFVQSNDEASFLEILQRHSSMVMGVCQSLLWHQQDAEDAFQATFLILARKASQLLRHPSVSGWLHQVAVRNCLNVRRERQRKREVELNQEPVSDSNEPWKSIADSHDRTLVQQEISRLPKKYRDVIILCHLEGRSRSEAADSLNCTTASIKASLARGRQLLRQRLIRHGIAASSVLSVLAAATVHAKQQIPQQTLESLAGLCSQVLGSSNLASVSNTTQHLLQKELTQMNFALVTKIGTYVGLGLSILVIPALLLAQQNPSETSQSSLQLSPSRTVESPNAVSIEPDSETGVTSDVSNQEQTQSVSDPRNAMDSLLFEASKDSPQYWTLMKKASESRIKDLQVQIKNFDPERAGSPSPLELEARMFEEQAKVIQINLLLKQLESGGSETPARSQNTSTPSGSSDYVPPASNVDFQPGEVLTIEFPGKWLPGRTIVVSSDHCVSLPLLGVISIEGLNPKELNEQLKEKYKKYSSDQMPIDIFRGELPSRTGNQIPLPSTAPIQPGEHLWMESFTLKTLNRKLVVQSDSTIVVPLIGTIHAEGLTPEQFAKKLTVAAKQYVKDPRVEVFRGGILDPRETAKELFKD